MVLKSALLNITGNLVNKINWHKNLRTKFKDQLILAILHPKAKSSGTYTYFNFIAVEWPSRLDLLFKHGEPGFKLTGIDTIGINRQTLLENQTVENG